jgi:hypothetical protein
MSVKTLPKTVIAGPPAEYGSCRPAEVRPDWLPFESELDLENHPQMHRGERTKVQRDLAGDLLLQ